LGSDANPRELLLITPYSKNLVTVKAGDKPDETAKDLMDVVFKGQ
jgi:hypothetical protein